MGKGTGGKAGGGGPTWPPALSAPQQRPQDLQAEVAQAVDLMVRRGEVLAAGNRIGHGDDGHAGPSRRLDARAAGAKLLSPEEPSSLLFKINWDSVSPLGQ